MSKENEVVIVSVADEDRLWRRIHPDFYWFDPELGAKRLTSAAFKDTELSVYIEKLVAISGRTTADMLKGKYVSNGMVSFIAGFARSKGQEVIHKPHNADQDVDPAHGLVIGRKSHRTCLEFAEHCTWLVYPKE